MCVVRSFHLINWPIPLKASNNFISDCEKSLVTGGIDVSIPIPIPLTLRINIPSYFF